MNRVILEFLRQANFLHEFDILKSCALPNFVLLHIIANFVLRAAVKLQMQSECSQDGRLRVSVAV